MADADEKRLGRIRVPNRYGALAEVLREKILAGEFAPGEILPGERDLVEQTGLSRGSVREALRVLEAEGLVATKLGRYGGTVVQPQNEAALGHVVDLFIRGRRIRFEALLETRQAIEPTLAYLAACRRTDAELDLIRVKMEALEETITAGRHDVARGNIEWHLAVAAASHNELLTAFMNSTAEASIRASVIEDHGSDELRAGIVRAHRRVFEAIEAGDADAAHRRMARHLNAYSGELGQLAPREINLG
jgi:GntR family transcriptional repressor for pyruvate dehydrogenase complex